MSCRHARRQVTARARAGRRAPPNSRGNGHNRARGRDHSPPDKPDGTGSKLERGAQSPPPKAASSPDPSPALGTAAKSAGERTRLWGPGLGFKFYHFFLFPGSQRDPSLSWLFTISGPQISPLQSRTRIFTLCGCRDEQTLGKQGLKLQASWKWP